MIVFVGRWRRVRIVGCAVDWLSCDVVFYFCCGVAVAGGQAFPASGCVFVVGVSSFVLWLRLRPGPFF